MATTSAHFIKIILKGKMNYLSNISVTGRLLLGSVVYHGIYYHAIHWHRCITGKLDWLSICKSFLRLSFYPINHRMAKLVIPPTINKTVFACVSDITRNVGKIDHGQLNSPVIPSKYFAFVLWEFSQQQTICSGRTSDEDREVQVFISMTYNKPIYRIEHRAKCSNSSMLHIFR